MTPQDQEVLTLVGNAGGQIAAGASCLIGKDAAIVDCVASGWLASASSGGDGIGGFVIGISGIGAPYYLMGALGENALAAALAPEG